MLAVNFESRTKFSINGQQVAEYAHLSDGIKALGEYLHPRRFSGEFRDRVVDALARAFSDRIRDTIIGQRMPDAPSLKFVTVAIKTAEGAQRPNSRLADKGVLLSRGLVTKTLGPGRRMLMFEGMASTHDQERPTALAQVAAVMEYGRDFQVTEKMRRFFGAMVGTKGWPEHMRKWAVGQWVSLPPRPFMYPSSKRLESEIPGIIGQIFNEEMAHMPGRSVRASNFRSKV